MIVVILNCGVSYSFSYSEQKPSTKVYTLAETECMGRQTCTNVQ